MSETTTDTTTPGDGPDAPVAVATPEELTPEWLSATLSAGGRPVEVTSVSHTAIGTGQMGSSYRLTLECASADAPTSIVAKMPSGDAEMSATEFVALVLGGVGQESDLAAVGALLRYAGQAVDQYSDPQHREDLRGDLRGGKIGLYLPILESRAAAGRYQGPYVAPEGR